MHSKTCSTDCTILRAAKKWRAPLRKRSARTAMDADADAPSKMWLRVTSRQKDKTLKMICHSAAMKFAQRLKAGVEKEKPCWGYLFTVDEVPSKVWLEKFTARYTQRTAATSLYFCRGRDFLRSLWMRAVVGEGLGAGFKNVSTQCMFCALSQVRLVRLDRKVCLFFTLQNAFGIWETRWSLKIYKLEVQMMSQDFTATETAKSTILSSVNWM